MSNLKRIFISRKLSSDSPIRTVAKGHFIKDQSLIQFSSLEFDPPEADWVFFYSRNAVRFFFEETHLELYPYQYACLSHGTAEELSKYVLDISFVGNGKPEEVAQQFQEVRKPYEPVCFIRANNSVDSIRNLLESENTFSIPVYDNQPIEDIPVEDFDILIFTSPINVNAWFSNNKYVNQTVIAIGKTTESAVKKFVNKEVLVADEPSEIALCNVLSKLL
ncbi:MAG: uroporphyrinogen-III synthase [Saprospiraceae bacterium]|jgi:uroporphyrinogen-III synthase